MLIYILTNKVMIDRTDASYINEGMKIAFERAIQEFEKFSKGYIGNRKDLPRYSREREYMNRMISLLYKTKQPHADVLCEISYNAEENKKNMQALGSVIGLMLLSSLITYLVLVFI